MSQEELNPLLDQKSDPVKLGQLRVKQFNEKEEATVIDSLTLLEFSCAKTYLLFPVLCVLSAFVYPICVYWYPSL